MTIADAPGLTAPTPDIAATAPTQIERRSSIRRYAMTRPTHFAVEYAINPWMDISTPVDADRAVAQWNNLVGTYRRLGHTVEFVEPEPGLPDMVYAANGGLIIDGHAIVARFKHPQRDGESAAYAAWMTDNGSHPGADPPRQRGPRRSAGQSAQSYWRAPGFAPTAGPTTEIAAITGKSVVTLELVDPRFYHLDTALAVLDDTTIAYYPPAFTERSRALLTIALPRRHRGRQFRCVRARAQRGLRWQARRTSRRRDRIRRAALCRRFRSGRSRSFRAAQGRRIREMLHIGGSLSDHYGRVDGDGHGRCGPPR